MNKVKKFFKRHLASLYVRFVAYLLYLSCEIDRDRYKYILSLSVDDRLEIYNKAYR